MADEQTTSKGSHGGARSGAGRKPWPEPAERVSVTLPQSMVQLIRERSGGNLARGIRRIVAAVYEHPEYLEYDESPTTAQAPQVISRREARALALKVAAGWIRIGVEGGALDESVAASIEGSKPQYEYDLADTDRIYEALNAIANELEARARRAAHTEEEAGE